jgi:DNA-binding transcriptional MocR family regulator
MRLHHCVHQNAAVSAAQAAVEKGLLLFTIPSGGLYLWCKLKVDLDLDSLIATLEERGVSVAPGHVFCPVALRGTYIRICYTAANETSVKRGIEILTRTLREAYAEHCEKNEEANSAVPDGWGNSTELSSSVTGAG